MKGEDSQQQFTTCADCVFSFSSLCRVFALTLVDTAQGKVDRLREDCAVDEDFLHQIAQIQYCTELSGGERRL